MCLHNWTTISQGVTLIQSFPKKITFFLFKWPLSLFTVCGLAFVSFSFFPHLACCCLPWDVPCVPAGSTEKAKQVCWLVHCTHKRTLQKSFWGAECQLGIVPVSGDLERLSPKCRVVVLCVQWEPILQSEKPFLFGVTEHSWVTNKNISLPVSPHKTLLLFHRSSQMGSSGGWRLCVSLLECVWARVLNLMVLNPWDDMMQGCNC